MDRTKLYTEQAAHCALRLGRTTDPQRKALIEREHRDWLDLARQRRTWVEGLARPSLVAQKLFA